MSSTLNIVEKTYRKLTVQVNLEGLSYCVFDTLQNQIVLVKDIQFEQYPKLSTTELNYEEVLATASVLKETYDEIVVLHDNDLCTFVPNVLFDENFAGSYLQYNNKVLENDFFAFDALSHYDLNLVYIPFVNINNLLLDQFETFDYMHVNSLLVSRILDLSKNIEDKQIYIHFSVRKFEILVVQNEQLILFNSYELTTKENFIYFVLFTIEQLNLNPEHLKMILLGEISETSEWFQILFKYIRNVTLLPEELLSNNNDFSIAQKLKHFILFQS